MARNSAKPTHASMKTAGNPLPGQHASAPRNRPTHEQIARRAYEIFLARGGQPGSPEQDWYQAERELMLGR